MSISRKTLALLTAAIIGTGLVACQRGGQDKSASSQDSSSMNQAPKQGYTGPANPTAPSPSTTPGSTSESQGGQTPGSTQQQQQPQENQQQR